MNLSKLTHNFYNRDTTQVAQDLLGKYLVHHHQGQEQIAKIVETEAYLGPHDLAAHSARGRTPRTEVMFGPGGYAYVYLIYGMYYCMNVVTESEGHASAVLLRAVEPIQNIHTRTQGPGLLCKAMGITKLLNAEDMMSEHFYIAEAELVEHMEIVARPRIGVDYAGEWAKSLLRFYVKDNLYVSKK